MTAGEIMDFKLNMDPDAVEGFLLENWEKGRLGKRPAEYPHETNLFRLWGHEDVVGVRDRSEVEPRRLEASDGLDRLDVPKDGPGVKPSARYSAFCCKAEYPGVDVSIRAFTGTDYRSGAGCDDAVRCRHRAT
jgi:hypothetical protein